MKKIQRNLTLLIFVCGFFGLALNHSVFAATVPSSPTNLLAIAQSSSAIKLSWTAPSNNGGSSIKGYEIQRSSDGGNTWSTIKSNTGSTSTTFSNTGLLQATTYTYRVFAINSVGTSLPSNKASAITFGPPSAPTGLGAIASSSSKINLSWTAPSNNGGSKIQGYKIQRSSDGGVTWYTIVSNTWSTTTTYSDSGLKPATSYNYSVYAINSVGTSAPSNIVTTKTLPTIPKSPSNLTTIASSTSKIKLSWISPSYNGGSPITGYKIMRASPAWQSLSVIATIGNVTSYSDTGLSSNTQYGYEVAAINSVGTSSYSSESSTFTLANNPTSLVANPGNSTAVNLLWKAPAGPISGYKIERSSDGGNTWSTVVANTGTTNTKHTNTQLSSSTSYTYRVSAINSGGTSLPSNTSSATTLASNSIFANCSIGRGCNANCSPPLTDPIATGKKNYDQFDGCILEAMKVAKMNQTWQGQILKAQMVYESGLVPSINPGQYSCGGQNCGPWAISAGSISGDSPPGPCGSSNMDPETGLVDYSHTYGLFQSAPACDGVFGLTSNLSGYVCTATTTADLIPFSSLIYFYCESATSLHGSQHFIDSTQNTSSPLYAKSVFNPAYQIYVYFAQWPGNFQISSSKVTGCTLMQGWYLTLAHWLTGNILSSCTLSSSSSSYNYVKKIINDYQTPLYGTAWPYPFP